MAGNITISRGGMNDLAVKLDSAYDQLTGIMTRLDEIKTALASVWADEAFVDFEPEYEQQINRLMGFKVSIDATASLLRYVAAQYEAAESKLRAKL